jgi:hypothetical protein
MDAMQIFRNSWRITWQNWRLWVIIFLMLITFTPSLVISMSFSFLVQSVHMPPELTEPFIRINPIYSFSERTISVLAIAGLSVMVVSLSLSWILQAAAMRITYQAVEGKKLNLKQAFDIGRDRFINIIKLSIVFGLIIAGIAYTPVLLFIIAPAGTPAEILFRLLQPIIGPINMVLNFVVLLLLMAVALDKSGAQDSIGRAWNVFKSGWVHFVVVIVGTSILTIFLGLLVIPLMVALVILIIIDASPIVLGSAGFIIGLLIMGILLFQGVFSLVIYTVTYRASSKVESRKLKAVEVYVA